MTYEERKVLIKSYLGKMVDIKIDRPIGYVHKKEKYSLVYPINYGYIPDVLGGDGEEMDVYLLGVSEPVTEYRVKIIGIVHRENDVEDKLVAAPKGINFTKDEIEKAVYFQEQYYKTYVEVEKMLTHKGTETIHTKRLTLRKFKVEDANDMFVWASNPEVVKYLSYKPHTSPEATADLLKGWVGAYNSNQVYNWAIELNGIVVGSISVVDSSDKCSYCHLGWQIDKPFWNKGYMTEAAKAVVDFLFSKVGYNRIQSGHDTRNIGSGRVMEKIGMSLEGTLRQYCHQKDGSIGDKHLWAILKSDWEKNKNINKNDKIIADISNFIFVSDTPHKVDAIFLPGGSHPEQPEYAAELYKQGIAPILIVSGGVSVKRTKFDGVKSKADIYDGDYKTDCEFLTDALNKNGVPLEQIYGDNKSGHTRDNAFFSKKVADENGLSIKTAIIVCKAFHARRCLMLYSLAFPDTKFYVCPVVCMGITKDNWYKSEQGIDRVLGELARCGNQFVGDIKEYLL